MNNETQERLVYVKAAIADISEQMKKPLSYEERQMLHLDRKDFRAELARLEAKTK